MPITLAEQLLLLALHDSMGRRSTWTRIDAGLAGALILDLLRHGWAQERAGDVLAFRVDWQAEPRLLADAARAIRKSAGPRGVRGWVAQLPEELKPIQHCVARSLVERGVLGERRRALLGVLPRMSFPERDPVPERRLRAGLREALLAEREPTDDEALLVPLLASYRLIEDLVPRDRRNDARLRAREIARRDPESPSGAVATAMEAAYVGVMMAVAISTPRPRHAAHMGGGWGGDGFASDAWGGGGGDGGGGDGRRLSPRWVTRRTCRRAAAPARRR